MEVIKKIISLEQAKTRAEGGEYGTLTATSFYFKVQFNQTIDDMGMFTDVPYIPSIPSISGVKTLTMGEKFLRVNDVGVGAWFKSGDKITGLTDSKLEGLKTYKPSTPYVVGFDIEKETYKNYKGNTVVGVSRVTSISGDTIVYTYDARNDNNIGTQNQTTGILYSEDITSTIPSGTTMVFNAEGWNTTNASLSAITKEEYLMGIINPPEVKNDVFIDRGVVTVMESHLRLSEVESLDHLVRYGNGFYNVVKQ